VDARAARDRAARGNVGTRMWDSVTRHGLFGPDWPACARGRS